MLHCGTASTLICCQAPGLAEEGTLSVVLWAGNVELMVTPSSLKQPLLKLYLRRIGNSDMYKTKGDVLAATSLLREKTLYPGFLYS